MSNPDNDIKEGNYQDSRVGRKPQPGDDDISSWKYYGTISLVILVGIGVFVSMFLA